MRGKERELQNTTSPDFKDLPFAFYSTWIKLREPWVYGRPIGLELADRLINEPDLHRLALIGPPGAGKTILARQIEGILQLKGIAVNRVQFDDFASQQEREFLEAGYSRPLPFLWNEEWKSVARRMLEQARQQFTTSVEGQKSIQILEMPAIGNEENLDRAITTLNELSKEGGIMVIGIPADPRTQRKSWQMRTALIPFTTSEGVKSFYNPQTRKIEEFDPRWVKHYLEKVYKTKVIWLFSKKPPTAEEEGEILVDILKKAAPEKAISLVKEEVRESVDRMLKEEGKTTRNLPILPSLPKASPYSLYGNFLEGEYQEYQISVYYTRKQIQRLVSNFGLKKDRGIVALNTYDEDMVYWYV